MGFDVRIDESATTRFQRFAGDDDTRLAAIHRVAAQAPDVALATRGGYGLTRLLDRIDWQLIAKSVQRGTRWVGHSDFTVFQLGLLAHEGISRSMITWAGPLAYDDFGRTDRYGGMNEDTCRYFAGAMNGSLQGIEYHTDAGFDGMVTSGILWGGNLSMVNSVLGTPHFPEPTAGLLFLEDINEQPYRLERMLLQLHQAGILDNQKAILLGGFTGECVFTANHGFSLDQVVRRLRQTTRTPVLSNLPFGHLAAKATLPVGQVVRLKITGEKAALSWSANTQRC